MAWGNGYTYRTTATITADQITGSLSNYPALVSLSSANLATAANGGGVQNTTTQTVGSYELTVPADFLVTSDSEGSVQIAGVEFESYDATTGTALVWVNVPDASVGNTIYIWYGNESVNTLQGTPSDTWPADYQGVWHLPNGSTLYAGDSTSNANNGSIVESVSPGPVAGSGQIDGGVSISYDGYIDFGSASNLDQPDGFTASFWLKPVGNGDTEYYLDRWTYTVHGYRQWSFDSAGAANTIEFRASTDGSDGGTEAATYSSLVNDAWVKVDGVWTGSDLLLYVDGVLQATTPIAGVISTSGQHTFLGGGDDGTANPCNASLDEVRFSSAVKTADWIAADYANQSAPGTFWSISYDATGDGGGLSNAEVMLVLFKHRDDS
jgi:hypothetical protein